MAINDDTDYPRLTPPDDRYPSPGNLFRSANDLTDDQFDLLAAAWSENALSDDSLAEIETLFASIPGRKAYAENFRQLRLRPRDDEWKGLNALLRTTPAAKIIRRVFIVTIAAAAVAFTFLVLKPFAEKQPAITVPVISHEVAMAPEAIETVPPAAGKKMPEPVVAIMETYVTAEKEEHHATEQEQAVKITPIIVSSRTETPVITERPDSRELLAVNLKEIPASLNIPEKEENWIMKGIDGLSKTIRKEKTPVDGYVIAKSCIKGINSVFGSEIELKKVISEEGDTVAVSFNSSLLSFSAPVRKSSQ
jgi:hypothetical protein